MTFERRSEESAIVLSASNQQNSFQPSLSDDKKDLSEASYSLVIEEDEDDEEKSLDEDLEYFDVEEKAEVSRAVPRQRPQSAAPAPAPTRFRAVTAEQITKKPFEQV